LGYKDSNSKIKDLSRNIKTPTPKQNNQLGTLRHQLQNKTINQEHRNANSKTKHSTMNIKTPTPNENIQLAT
jgi:hypothetical protein